MQPTASTAEFGFSSMRFKYDEFDDDGSILDTEQGVIPGLSFRFAQRILEWEWEGRVSYHYGRVSYDGQTNLGDPYSTLTDEELGDFALRMGLWAEIGIPVMPYIGMGYRRWDRDILPASLGGLFESYRWGYTWVGAKLVAYQQGASNLMLDIGWLKPIDPVLHVDFKGAYKVSPSVYPESRSGLRMMLTSQTALDENATLTLEPYFEYWQLGRSPTVTTGGITLYEPASKTKNLGVNVRLGWMF